MAKWITWLAIYIYISVMSQSILPFSRRLNSLTLLLRYNEPNLGLFDSGFFQPRLVRVRISPNELVFEQLGGSSV